jgi:hypothetical protein
MRWILAYGLKETIGAVALSCFIAGGVGAMTAPTLVENSNAPTISVDRTHKGDRLPQAPIHRQRSTESSIVPPSSKRVPLGCDPAFSSVADPARAHIFKRCMT